MALSIRPNVLKMRPYSPGKPIAELKRELGVEPIYKLASNENPLGPSPKAVAAMKAAAETVNLYPDAATYDLKHALSEHFGIGAEHIFLGNGSDECIRMLGWVLLDGPEDQVVVGDPSFICYDEAAHLAPCELVKVPLDAQQRHDLPAMARAVTERTKIVFIANPNNPTGTLVRKSEVDAFLADMPPQVLVVLDEAYCEFAAHLTDYPNGLDYLKEGKQVCTLRTFSKTYGLAGIRVGYGFGPAKLIDAIQRARQPFNVNSLAQVAAIAALGDEDHLRATIENNARGLVRIADALRAVGATPCESYANFVYADLGRPAKPIFEDLLKRGIIVRTGDPFGRPNAIRVSVGTETEIDAFIAALNEVMEALPTR